MKTICIGDSITFGYGLKYSEKWINLLNRMDAGEFINSGVNGDTTNGMLARFHADVIQHKPDRVLIMGGPNDFFMESSTGQVKTNLMSMVHHALAAGIYPVVASHIPANYKNAPEYWKQLADFDAAYARVEEIHEWLPAFARAFNVGYIDTYAEFTRAIGGDMDRYFGPDGLHINAQGAEILARIMYEGFKRMNPGM